MQTADAKILAVVVLYQTNASVGLTLPSFFQALEDANLASRFSLLVYDNSPARLKLPDKIPAPLTHVHDSANGGLLRAYNTALLVAEQEKKDWLLLLDQDTVINADYLTILCASVTTAAENPRCAALVPRLWSENKIISPVRVLWGGRLLPVDKNLRGISPDEVMAVNSGTLLRVAAVRAIGGFNPLFWLDYLDHWLFNRLHRAGYSTYVVDAALSHNLSVRNMADMPEARYKNILLAEGEFYRCCKSPVENRVYYFRVLMRAVKMLVSPRKRRFFVPTLEHLIDQVRRGHRSSHAARDTK